MPTLVNVGSMPSWAPLPSIAIVQSQYDSVVDQIYANCTLSLGGGYLSEAEITTDTIAVPGIYYGSYRSRNTINLSPEVVVVINEGNSIESIDAKGVLVAQGSWFRNRDIDSLRVHLSGIFGFEFPRLLEEWLPQ